MQPTSADTPEGPRIAAILVKLDGALKGLRAIQSAEVRVGTVEASLGSALQHVYAAIAGQGSHVEFRQETQAALARVREALATLMEHPIEEGSVAESVASQLAATLGELQHVRWSMTEGAHLPRGDARPFVRASHLDPQLLDLQRRVMQPAVPLDEPPLDLSLPEYVEVLPAPPATMEELRALAAANAEKLKEFEAKADEEKPKAIEGAPEPLEFDHEDNERVRFGYQVSDHDLLRERAREIMEDLAMFGRMRRCTPPEPWACGEETERRMLLKVDGLAACGVDVFPELVRCLDDRPMPDPELTFGNLFFFLSVAGDDTFDQAVRLLDLSELDAPGMFEMCVDAFVFAPHERIVPILGLWLAHPDPVRRRLAVEALRRRRALSYEQFEQMGNDVDPMVLASLARAMPTLPAMPPSGALGWYLMHQQEDVVRGALQSAAFLQRPRGLQRAIEITMSGQGSWADAVMFVAIAGRPEDRSVLEHAIATEGSPTAMRALGWYGDPSFIPYLLGRLHDGDDAEKGAALEALERLTGASIVDAALVPTYEPKEEPFSREERLEYLPPGLLDGTPEAWSDWWVAWRDHVQPQVRYRWGQLWSVQDVQWELRHGAFPQRDRPWAAFELQYHAPREPLDWNDFIHRQRRIVGPDPEA